MGGAVESWELLQVPPPTPNPPAGVGIASGQPAFLGFGLVTPFHRGANDFDSAGGFALVASCVKQVLGTVGDTPISGGELPWRTEFGSALQRLRQQNQGYMLVELARAYVVDAIARWEPRVKVANVRIGASTTKRTLFSLFVQVVPISANVPANLVNLPEVEVPLAA